MHEKLIVINAHREKEKALQIADILIQQFHNKYVCSCFMELKVDSIELAKLTATMLTFIMPRGNSLVPI